MDANILFSILVKDGFNAFIASNPQINLLVPDFIFQEFEEHKEEITSKTKRTTENFKDILDNLLNNIKVIPSEFYIEKSEEADIISPDKDDVMYFALALKLNCAIWSNDKKLKEQNKIKVYSTEDLMQILNQL